MFDWSLLCVVLLSVLWVCSGEPICPNNQPSVFSSFPSSAQASQVSLHYSFDVDSNDLTCITTITGAAPYVSRNISRFGGGSLYLGGRTYQTDQWPTPSTDYSASFWVYPVSSGFANSRPVFQAGGWDQSWFSVLVSASQVTLVVSGQPNAIYKPRFMSELLPNNTWAHFVVTYSSAGSGSSALYINGVLRKTSGYPAGSPFQGAYISIGGGVKGYMDELWVHNIALDQRGVTQLFTSNYHMCPYPTDATQCNGGTRAFPQPLYASILPTDVLSPCLYNQVSLYKFYWYFGSYSGSTRYPNVYNNYLPYSGSDALNEVVFWKSVVNSAAFDIGIIPDCFPYPTLSDANFASVVSDFTGTINGFDPWYESGVLELYQPSNDAGRTLLSRLDSILAVRNRVQTDFRQDIIEFYTYLTSSSIATVSGLTGLFVQAEINAVWGALEELEEELSRESVITLITDLLLIGMSYGSLATGGVGAVIAGSIATAWTQTIIDIGTEVSSPTLPTQGNTPVSVSFSNFGADGGGGVLASVSDATGVFSSVQAPITAYEIYHSLNAMNGYYIGMADSMTLNVISNYGYLRVFNLLNALSSGSFTDTTTVLGHLLTTQSTLFAQTVLMKLFQGAFNIVGDSGTCTISRVDESVGKEWKDSSWQPVRDAFAAEFSDVWILAQAPNSNNQYSPCTNYSQIHDTSFMPAAAYTSQLAASAEFGDFFIGVQPQVTVYDFEWPLETNAGAGSQYCYQSQSSCPGGGILDSFTNMTWGNGGVATSAGGNPWNAPSGSPQGTQYSFVQTKQNIHQGSYMDLTVATLTPNRTLIMSYMYATRNTDSFDSNLQVTVQFQYRPISGAAYKFDTLDQFTITAKTPWTTRQVPAYTPTVGGGTLIFDVYNINNSQDQSVLLDNVIISS